jgi:hypothetical protein
VLAVVLTLGNFPGRPEQTHQPDSARPQLQPLAMPSPFAPLRGRLTLSAPVQQGRRRLFARLCASGCRHYRRAAADHVEAADCVLGVSATQQRRCPA